VEALGAAAIPTKVAAYTGEVKAATGASVVRGILVAPGFQAKALAAASMIPNLVQGVVAIVVLS
jgi:hypothetical protein